MLEAEARLLGRRDKDLDASVDSDHGWRIFSYAYFVDYDAEKRDRSHFWEFEDSLSVIG